MTATGTLVANFPPGPERDELLGLVRIGYAFRQQHKGRAPGRLSKLIQETVASMSNPPTLENLLDELALLAARREMHGPDASMIEKVDRSWRLVTVNDPQRRQVTFKTVEGHLTRAKKNLNKANLSNA